MIKAIIFDCFGVLTTDKWKEFSGELPDVVRRQARELNHAYGSGFIDRQEFIAQVAEVTGKPEKDVEDSITGDTTKNHALLDYIKELKQTYKIGLLSNIADNWIRDTFLNKDEQALFDAMVLSFEVGTTKPNPSIFELACEKLDIEPSEAIFVDDVASYCQAAEVLGMKTVVYHDLAAAKRAISQFVSSDAS